LWKIIWQFGKIDYSFQLYTLDFQIWQQKSQFCPLRHRWQGRRKEARLNGLWKIIWQFGKNDDSFQLYTMDFQIWQQKSHF
jgi:hypothetical protein